MTDHEITDTDLDMGDALLDAVRLLVAGDETASVLAAIPHLRQDPVSAGSFLVSLVAHAVRAYARATGYDPVHAVDVLWSKPARDTTAPATPPPAAPAVSRLTTDPNHPSLTRGADPADGPRRDQSNVYLVLSDEERAKGFVRPVRNAYWHTVCGGVTTMHPTIAETYARDPHFYGATYCAFCRRHRPVGPGGEFHWVDPAHPERQSPTMDPKVGT